MAEKKKFKLKKERPKGTNRKWKEQLPFVNTKKKKKQTDTSINYQLLSFTEEPFYAFISYR